MQITILLQQLQANDPNAMHQVMPLVYNELKKLAKAHLRHELGAPSLQTTALVHEAFLKLAGSRHPSYENRAHFYGIASRLMRQVLVDAARTRGARKRGIGQELAVPELPDWAPRPDKSLLVMEDALRTLEKSDPLKVQLIEMRFFGGMTAEESSVAVSKPVHTVRRELRLALAWLRKEMAGTNDMPGMLNYPPSHAMQGAL
jgi:RNA polymerase sigma factor (TIGR02999 family)